MRLIRLYCACSSCYGDRLKSTFLPYLSMIGGGMHTHADHGDPVAINRAKNVGFLVGYVAQ
jgi:hypothetical protein